MLGAGGEAVPVRLSSLRESVAGLQEEEAEEEQEEDAPCQASGSEGKDYYRGLNI